MRGASKGWKELLDLYAMRFPDPYLWEGSSSRKYWLRIQIRDTEQKIFGPYICNKLMISRSKWLARTKRKASRLMKQPCAISKEYGGRQQSPGNGRNGVWKMSNRKMKLHKVLRSRPDPNNQKFWLLSPGTEGAKFLLNRFNAHYIKFLDEMGDAINNE